MSGPPVDGEASPPAAVPPVTAAVQSPPSPAGARPDSPAPVPPVPNPAQVMQAVIASVTQFAPCRCGQLFVDKVTPEHLTAMIDIERGRDVPVSDNRKDDRKFHLLLAGMACVFVLALVSLLLFRGTPALTEAVLLSLVGVAVGAFGGYGFGKSKRTSLTGGGREPPKGVNRPATDTRAMAGWYCARAELMHQRFVASWMKISGGRPVSDLSVPVTPAQDFRRFAYSAYFMATLYTVVEVWPKHFTDPTVDALLDATHESYTSLLREVRNNVYHFRALDSPAVRAFSGSRAFIRWVTQLADAMQAYLARTV